MGTGASQSQSSLAAQAAKEKNKEIERQFKVDLASELKLVKLLLLGAAESGKSTFAKQMKIIHMQGFSVNERLSYKHLIYSNTMRSICDILLAMKELNIPLEENERKDDIFLVQKSAAPIDRGDLDLSPEVAEALKRLWQDGGVKLCFSTCTGYHLNDSTEYYMDALDRLSAASYVPSEQDVLRARIQTTGVIETRFRYTGYEFRMFDVGGQRSERRKWIHCFDNVTAIIFTIAMSDYDQVLREDSTMNRLHESMNLFRTISHNEHFRRTTIILLLNKKDIFEKKILTSPLTICFPFYSGKNQYSEASVYIRSKFERIAAHKQNIYGHFTNATDTKNIDFVFAASMAVVLQKNLQEAGMF